MPPNSPIIRESRCPLIKDLREGQVPLHVPEQDDIILLNEPPPFQEPVRTVQALVNINADKDIRFTRPSSEAPFNLGLRRKGKIVLALGEAVTELTLRHIDEDAWRLLQDERGNPAIANKRVFNFFCVILSSQVYGKQNPTEFD